MTHILEHEYMADSLKSLEMVSASQGLARSVHINPSHTLLLLLLLLLATKILTKAETLFLKNLPPPLLKVPLEMEDGGSTSLQTGDTVYTF